MDRFLLTIIFLFFAAPAFCGKLASEGIPNSELKVSFPSDWNFTKPYGGNGRYSSIQIHLPSDSPGSYRAYPKFAFEFLETGPEIASLKYILNTERSPVSVGGIDSQLFKYRSGVRSLHDDMSHSVSEIQVTGYLVPIGNGNLICTLTTSYDSEKMSMLDLLIR